MTTLTLEGGFQPQSSALFGRDRTVRREIRRWWRPNPRWVAWLMLNPSNAGEIHNDPTALRVGEFTHSWGFDGWIGVNLYPFVTSNPAEMWHRADWLNNGPDWYSRDDLMGNLDDIEHVARIVSLRIVAFGAQPIVKDEPWLEQCLERFMQPSDIGADERLYCLAKTQSGQPRHPLARGKHRVAKTAIPMEWLRA